MQSLSKADERQLLDGVKMAVTLVDNQGLSPNAALQKAAETLHYSPGFLKAACNAFNTGRQLAQWNANDAILDKLASFPLADYSEIHDKMWGTAKEKVAAATVGTPRFNSYEDQARQELRDWDLSSFQKTAEVAEVRPSFYREHAKCEYLTRLAEEARREKSAMADRLGASLMALSEYFQKSAYDRLALAQVEYVASTYYGETGKALISHIAEQFPTEKRANAYPTSWPGFYQEADRKQAPYTLIEDTIKQAGAHWRATEVKEAADTKLAEAKESVAPFTFPRSSALNGSQVILTPSLVAEVAGVKQSGFFTDPFSMGPKGLELLDSYADDARNSATKKIVIKLENPAHKAELRKIRAQTILTGMLSDPGNPLSRYAPEDVLSAYNDLVQLSPRFADQPAVLGPLLNRRLMGNVEPFEIAEALKMEEGFKKTQTLYSSEGD